MATMAYLQSGVLFFNAERWWDGVSDEGLEEEGGGTEVV